MNIVQGWLLVGLGVYLAAGVMNRKTFVEATAWELFKGLFLGLVLWPLALEILSSKSK